MKNKLVVAALFCFALVIFLSSTQFKTQAQQAPFVITSNELAPGSIVNHQYSQAVFSSPVQLSLEISTSQQNFLIAEPVSINLTLSNQTNQPIQWRGILGGITHTAFVSINKDGVKSRLDGNKSATPFIYMGLKNAQPGERIQRSSILDRDAVEKLFPTAGQYDLQVEFIYDRNVEGEQPTKILSNLLRININEPQGVNRQAHQYIKEGLNGIRFRSNQQKAQLEQEFVDRYRNSVYAKYIIFNLANTYQAMSEDAKALRELCKVSGENFHHSKNVEEIVLRIDEILNPVTQNGGVPITPRKHPCSGIVLD